MMNMLHGVIAVQQFPGATSKLKKSESRLVRLAVSLCIRSTL